MLNVLAATSILFLSIFAGFLFGRFKIFTVEASSILIRYVFYMALPSALFLSCYKAEFSLFNVKYLTSYVLATLCVIAIYFFISRKILKNDIRTSIMNSMPVTQVDGAYYSIPLITLLFGSAASIIPLMAIQNILFFTFIIFLIEIFSNSKNEKNKGYFIFNKMKSVLFKNPIILSSIAGFSFALLNIPLAEKIIQFLHFFGSSSSPVALFSLGLSFSASITTVWKMKDVQKEVILLTIGKLLIYPLVVWIIGYYLSVPQELMAPLILMCASPAATHNYIIASQYKLNDQVQTNIIVITTVLSFITINLFLFVI